MQISKIEITRELLNKKNQDINLKENKIRMLQEMDLKLEFMIKKKKLE